MRRPPPSSRSGDRRRTAAWRAHGPFLSVLIILPGLLALFELLATQTELKFLLFPRWPPSATGSSANPTARPPAGAA